MIRFIDLRAQSTGHRFAFWDTVTDRFVEFSGSQAWETLDEFRGDYATSRGDEKSRYPELSRFEQLCPPWATAPVTDLDEL